ncbi:right-handed parallel beta-helix repeat-containing protein [Candidatus Hydrogenedentota bacterium]
MTEAVTIKVSDFGAKVDDGKSDTEQIRAAINECAGKKNVRVVFEKGRYDLWPGAEEEKNERDGYSTFFSFENVDGLVIEGNGAELIGHEVAGFFMFSKCKDVTINNLTIDMDPLPFTSGKVISARDKTFELQVSPPHQALGGVLVEGVLGYDPEAGRPAVRGLDLYQLDFTGRTKVARPGILQVPITYKLPEVGANVIVRHRIYGSSAFTFVKCENTTLEDVTVYAVAGFGVHGADSKDFKLKRYRTMIRPDSGRWMSAAADATHFNTCRGTITLEDCLFEGMGDDATNLHLMYLVVIKKESRRALRLAIARDHLWMPTAPRPGDKIEIGGGDVPLIPYATITVESVEEDREAKEIVVTFTDDLPERTGEGHILGNASACPKARIRNCIVRNNRARGMLIQTRDVVLENNRFEYCSGAALHIASDVNYWNEGMGVRDIVIRNNKFIGCNYGAARRGAVIDIFSELKGGKLAPAGVHRSIVIEGNTFENPDGSAIHVNSADGVVIRNNKIDGPADAAIAVDHSRNVEIIGNELTNSPKSGLKIGDDRDLETVKTRNNIGF